MPRGLRSGFWRSWPGKPATAAACWGEGTRMALGPDGGLPPSPQPVDIPAVAGDRRAGGLAAAERERAGPRPRLHGRGRLWMLDELARLGIVAEVTGMTAAAAPGACTGSGTWSRSGPRRRPPPAPERRTPRAAEKVLCHHSPNCRPSRDPTGPADGDTGSRQGDTARFRFRSARTA